MPEVTKTQEQLSKELDKKLLARITKGYKVVDKATGKLKTIAATAADLNVARQRLKDLGLTQLVNAGDSAATLAKEIGFERDHKILDMPPLSDKDDPATKTA